MEYLSVVIEIFIIKNNIIVQYFILSFPLV